MFKSRTAIAAALACAGALATTAPVASAAAIGDLCQVNGPGGFAVVSPSGTLQNGTWVRITAYWSGNRYQIRHSGNYYGISRDAIKQSSCG